jgi:Flp pilus assembly protein TadG
MLISRSRKNYGQALVEWALILPILLLIILVTIDMGRAVYYYSVIYNAAREGARYGTIDHTDTEGIEAAAKNLAVGLDTSPSVFGVSTFTNGPPLTHIRVTVTYQFFPATPMVTALFESNHITLTSQSTMRIE